MNYLEIGFRLLAVGCAMSYGYSFTPDCQMHLNEMIRQGVASLPDPPTRGDIEMAQTDLVKFVSRMVEEAKILNLEELHEPTFFNAKSFLCPLPPWIRRPC